MCSILLEMCFSSMYHFSSAYEDKQHSKRKEISSRSWFNTSPAASGSAAGSLLHKLSLQGKEAAVAKALSSSHSPLIRKRSGGVKTEPCATISRRLSQPEINTCDVETLKESKITLLTHRGQEAMETNSCSLKEMHVKTTEAADDGEKNTKVCVDEKNQDTCLVTSLVADYSDSDSDPGL